MTLNPLDLQHITGATLKHYNEHAEAFWQGTRDHDVSQNIEALLTSIEAEPPFTILDFGCGPGRDLKAFREFGHIAIGLDGAEPFVLMARGHSGCKVWHQEFLRLDLPAAYFDGIFAMQRCFMSPAKNCRAAKGLAHGAQARWRPFELESARPRSKAGVPAVTVLITILRRGGAMLSGPVSLKSCITTVPQACRATSSPGLQAPGESRNSQRASFNLANAGQRFKWGSRPKRSIRCKKLC